MDMIIVERYAGEIENYNGCCCVLVTDREMSAGEYYYLKGKMLARGIELVSTKYVDTENLSQVVVKNVQEKRSRGRRRFGEDSEAEMAVVRRIFELRDAGRTMKEITEDEKVCYLDGRRMVVSTIQTILNNREKYEE
jgi:hypothetical protein